MKVITYTRADGGLSIVIPAYGDRLRPDGDTDDEMIARCMAKAVPLDAISAQVIDDSEVPADRTFRNAWALNGAAVDHDMAKAREIHLNRIRLRRDAALAVLDIETIKAVGGGDDAERDRIEVLKQTLRDLPQTIAAELDAAQTPEDLKAIQPEIAVDPVTRGRG